MNLCKSLSKAPGGQDNQQSRLCKYKDVLGIPGEGFHKKRLSGFALNDVTGTIGIAVIITLLISVYKKYNNITTILKTYIASLFILIILGIILHRLFCVNTKLNMMIFGKV